MEQALHTLTTLSAQAEQTLGNLAVDLRAALALATCFFGWRLRKAWYTLLVFLAAALLAYGLSAWLLPDRTLLQLAIALAAGLIAGACTLRLYRALSFVVGFYCGFVLVQQLCAALPSLAGLALALAAGVLVGVLAAKHQYQVIIFSTAISGGGRAAAALAQRLSLPADTLYLLALALIVAGAAVQLLTTRSRGG